MNSDNYKLIEPTNLKIEKDLFEIQKTIIYMCRDLKKEIQIIKEKIEKIGKTENINSKEKTTETRNKTTIEYLTEHIAKIK